LILQNIYFLQYFSLFLPGAGKNITEQWYSDI